MYSLLSFSNFGYSDPLVVQLFFPHVIAVDGCSRGRVFRRSFAFPWYVLVNEWVGEQQMVILIPTTHVLRKALSI